MSRESDYRVSEITFTLPGDYKWTTVEAALKEAHDIEFERRFYFQTECVRLQAEVERLRKAGDAMAGNLDRFLNESISSCDWLRDGLSNWNAAKEGKPTP